MNRSSFIKSLVGLVVAPKMLMEIGAPDEIVRTVGEIHRFNPTYLNTRVENEPNTFIFIPETNEIYNIRRIFYYDEKGVLLYSRRI